MYNEHFGLKRAPFRITPDTKLFYPGGSRGEILDALIYAISSGEGIVKVVGEVGSGKTNIPTMPTIKPASAMSANRLMFVTRAPDRMSWRSACIAAPFEHSN